MPLKMQLCHLLWVASAVAVSQLPAGVAGEANAQDWAKPEVFSPGVISGAAHDSAPAFTPDGKTVYFGRSNASAAFILVSRENVCSGTLLGKSACKAAWSKPVIAPFSGRWLDMEPAMSPDGTYLVFVSNRPTAAGGVMLDGALNGVAQPGRGANLWRVERTASGWGEPKRLPDNVNAGTSTYAPSVAGNGDLYFMRPGDGSTRFRIFFAKRLPEGYADPEPVAFSDGQNTDVDPAVAPDETFMVFGSSRHAKKDIDLFIVFRNGDKWGEPVYLGDQVNSPTSDAEPRLGSDHHTLYFSSERVVAASLPIAARRGVGVLANMEEWNNGLYNIWRVDLAPWIKARGNPSPVRE